MCEVLWFPYADTTIFIYNIICIYRSHFRTVSEKAQWTLDIKPLTMCVRFGMGVRINTFVVVVCLRALLFYWFMYMVYTCVCMVVVLVLLSVSISLLLSICVYDVHRIYMSHLNSFACQLPKFHYVKPSEIFKSIQSIWCRLPKPKPPSKISRIHEGQRIK